LSTYNLDAHNPINVSAWDYKSGQILVTFFFLYDDNLIKTMFWKKFTRDKRKVLVGLLQ